MSRTSKNRTVLVVAAHPDDEILGCGATMSQHAAAGDHVYTLILGEGITSRDAKRDRAKRTARGCAIRICFSTSSQGILVYLAFQYAS